MAKFDVIVIDPPYSFSDSLNMSSVKRGAAAQYTVMDIEAIKKLPINDLSSEDSLLALWVVGSQLQNGLDLMKCWGFRQTQTWVWVKTKNAPLESLYKLIKKIKEKEKEINLIDIISQFNLHDVLAFKMGRLFRQTHEICLIGVKGKIYNKLKNKSQRSVCFDVTKRHSEKTEILQDRLEIMFGDVNYLELFARRPRKGWICIGNEANATKDQDIFVSSKLLNLL